MRQPGGKYHHHARHRFDAKRVTKGHAGMYDHFGTVTWIVDLKLSGKFDVVVFEFARSHVIHARPLIAWMRMYLVEMTAPADVCPSDETKSGIEFPDSR